MCASTTCGMAALRSAVATLLLGRSHTRVVSDILVLHVPHDRLNVSQNFRLAFLDVWSHGAARRAQVKHNTGLCSSQIPLCALVGTQFALRHLFTGKSDAIVLCQCLCSSLHRLRGLTRSHKRARDPLSFARAEVVEQHIVTTMLVSLNVRYCGLRQLKFEHPVHSTLGSQSIECLITLEKLGKLRKQCLVDVCKAACRSDCSPACPRAGALLQSVPMTVLRLRYVKSTMLL